MSPARKVKLYRDGDEQAVHIPRDLELPGEEAWLRQEAFGRLVLEAVEKDETFFSLIAALRAMSPAEAEDGPRL